MKPTWSKVYIGPGYPIDPAKEYERNQKICCEAYSCIIKSINGIPFDEFRKLNIDWITEQ